MGEIRKNNIINLSYAEFAQRMVKFEHIMIVICAKPIDFDQFGISLCTVLLPCSLHTTDNVSEQYGNKHDQTAQNLIRNTQMYGVTWTCDDGIYITGFFLLGMCVQCIQSKGISYADLLHFVQGVAGQPPKSLLKRRLL